MIEIRIRNEDEAIPVRLCDWDADNLDAVIPMIRRWGIQDAGNANMTGQIVVDHEDGLAYFEVAFTPQDD
jgi:hypothetical protein